MLRNFVRGFDNALSKEMCQSLIEWFESKPDVKTKEVNRETRNDKQMWLSETSKLYEPVQKVKLDMLQEYSEEFGWGVSQFPCGNNSLGKLYQSSGMDYLPKRCSEWRRGNRIFIR